MTDFDIQPEEKSKSQRKREMLALEELGMRLVELSSEQILSLELPSELSSALLDFKNMKKHEAKRRQRQRIGSLMRHVDPDPLQDLIAGIDQRKNVQTEEFHLLEDWRDRLVADEPDVWQEIVKNLPDIDIQHVRTLARNARKEKEKNKPPKAFRALFRYLREAAGGSV